MRRIVLDSNVVDVIRDTPGLFDQIKRATAAGHLVIIKNHITRDELDQTPEYRGRQDLLKIYETLPGEEVATEANALDNSRLGCFKLDDGAHTGTPLADLETGGRGRFKDALVGITAAGNADILVTNDGEFYDRVAASTAVCKVWWPEEFISFVTEKNTRTEPR